MAAVPSTIDKNDADIFDKKFASECKIAMKWLICEETLRKIETGECLYSEVFPAPIIPGVQYFLSFYPNGRCVTDSSSSCILLHLEMTEVNSINADCKIYIKSAFKEVKLGYTFDKYNNFYVNTCKAEELFDLEKKYIVDGILKIELEGTLKPRGLKRKAPTQNPNIVSQKLWERDDKDITILAKKQKIMIHRWVLTTRSPVFEAMFNSGMDEEKENEIIITDFTKDIVNIGVEFCYERNIKHLINEKNASELLRFTDKYDMADMKAIIESFLIENISEINVCEYANMSISSNCKDLREFCVSFLIKFINPQSFFNDMQKFDYEIMKEILRRSVNPISKTL